MQYAQHSKGKKWENGQSAIYFLNGQKYGTVKTQKCGNVENTKL